MRLIDLYRPINEAGPKGRTLSIADVERTDPEAASALDQIIDRAGASGNVAIRRVGNRLTAQISKGGGNWTWDGEEWTQVAPAATNDPNSMSAGDARWRRGQSDKRGDIKGGRPDMGQMPARDYSRNGPESAFRSVYDKFSQNPGEYQRGISAALAQAYGAGWDKVIDSVYGRGSVRKMFNDFWRNLWTDWEAVEEFGHYYDVAQQAAQEKRTSRRTGEPPTPGGLSNMTAQQYVGAYPIRIGPRYDVPMQTWLNDDDIDRFDAQWIRRQRVTSPEYFDRETGVGSNA